MYICNQLSNYQIQKTMQNNKKIIEIGKKLPHGAKKRIAVETGLHYNTVVGYFNGRSVSYHTESICQ